jgi:hypothetical protein
MSLGGRRKKGAKFKNGVDFPLKRLKSAKGTSEFFRGHNREQQILMHAILHGKNARKILGTCKVLKRVHDRFVRRIWGTITDHASPIVCRGGR